MENPLLQPFDLTPFSRIETAHFKPAFEKALQQARAEVDAIAENTDPPTFENTVAALDYAGYQLDRISSTFFNLNTADKNK
jgi:peptidyl-dipeptidase Dcp